MKVIIVMLFFISSLLSGEPEKGFMDIEAFKKITNEINIEEVLRDTSDYLDSLSSKDLNITGITSKLNNFADNALYKLKEKVRYFNVHKAQSVTYEVRVTTKKDIHSSGSAVALSSDGKLITAYHNIASYKSIQVVNSKGQSYPVKLGKVSVEHDLVYLYIDAENIPYAKAATKAYLGQDIYILSYDNLLLTGITSQIKENNIILNVEARKGTSGGGVFNSNNELVSILISKDVLDKTSTSVKPTVFHQVTEDYEVAKGVQRDANKYDTNYCYNKDDSKVWREHAKSKDLKIQELHALFKGLCNKVENRDISADEAQFIFESARYRLLEKSSD